jgi:hypothetical protein
MTMAIDWTPVKSSNINKVGYDADNKTMAVEFGDGTIYHYHDVEKNVHDDLVSAKSVGAHLHANVKGAYRFTKQ